MMDDGLVLYVIVGVSLVLARMDLAYERHVDRLKRAPSLASEALELVGLLAFAVVAWPWAAWVWIVEEE